MKTVWKGLAIGMAAMLLLSGCQTDTLSKDVSQAKTTVTTTTLSDGSQKSTASRRSISTTTAPDGLTKVPGASNQSRYTNAKLSDPTKITTTTGTTKKNIITDVFPKLGTIKVAGLGDCYFDFYASKNEWDRQIRNQLELIEKGMNGKFELAKYKTTDDLADTCIKAHKARTKFADIMVAPLHLQKKLTASKAIQDLNQINGLDLTQSYWDQNARRDMQLYGKNFAALTTLDGTAANANVIYFNKVLAKQIGSSDADLYKMVKDGTWTFKAMQNLSSKALNDIDGNPGYSDNDQFGFGGANLRGSVTYSIFKAQGGSFTSPTKDGGVVFALDMDSNIRALRGMQSWLLKDKSVYHPDKKETDWSRTQKAFTEGRLLFMGWTVDAAENFKNMINDWGILPYPMAEKGGKYVSAFDWDTPCFSVPSQVKKDDLYEAGQALTAIARSFDKIKDLKRAYNTNRVYRDGAKSQEMVDIAGAGATIDFCQFGELGEGGLTTFYYLMNSIDNDPAAMVKARKEKAVLALNNYLKTIK